MDNLPQVQYVAAVPAPGAPAGRSGTIFSKVSNTCRRTSGDAVDIIIVLLIVVAYLFARLKGWVGQLSGKPAGKAAAKSSMAGGRKSAGGGKRAANDASDDEIDSLINDILS